MLLVSGVPARRANNVHGAQSFRANGPVEAHTAAASCTSRLSDCQLRMVAVLGFGGLILP
jgi:hypothetical protein